MTTFGISGGGRAVEEEFRRLTGATTTARAALGDAVFEGVNIEVKAASSDTLNQVRAVKYIPLVAYGSTSAAWYVIPANVVVRMVATRARGQHTENPFESCTLSLRKLAAYRLHDPADLADVLRAAIAEAAREPQLRDEMSRTLAESRATAADSIARVRDLVVTSSWSDDQLLARYRRPTPG